MSYEYVEGITAADYAVRASGKTLGKLFESAAKGVTGIMIDSKTLGGKLSATLDGEAETVEELLFLFLEELLVVKDSKGVLFSSFSCVVSKDGKELHCSVRGDKIGSKGQDLLVDVKGITRHKFSLKKKKTGWEALVVLDV